MKLKYNITMKKKTKHVLRKHFVKHLFRNIFFGVVLSIASLLIGILGYHHFEDMSWTDSYVNAAMILSGMGPIGELHKEWGKLFAGTYAIFSGVIFLVIVSLVLAPVIRWVFVKFHIESDASKN